MEEEKGASMGMGLIYLMIAIGIIAIIVLQLLAS